MRALILSIFAVAACSSAAPVVQKTDGIQQQEAAAVPQLRIPTGARLESSGYLTIEQVPNSPVPAAEPPVRQDRTYYAQLADITNGEAAKRLKEQEQVQPEFQRLVEQLRAKERGNFTGAELIHKPDWAFLLFFKRDPEATLAKYTRNPRFQARHARYTEEELRELIRPWVRRFERERLFTGYGINARNGRAEIDMVVGEEEFAAIAERNGWGPLPDYLQLSFSGAPSGNAVDPAVAPAIRIFPRADRNLGIIHQAAFHGRIVLRDGCFRVVDLSGNEKLAYFAREVGLGLDQEGYLSLHSRTGERKHLGRIGEQFTWAGPIAIAEDAPMVSELRQRCGTAPLMHVGIPESSAIFNARYGLPRPPPPPPPTQPQAG